MAAGARVLGLFCDAEVARICARLDQGATRKEALLSILQDGEEAVESAPPASVETVEEAGPRGPPHRGDRHSRAEVGTQGSSPWEPCSEEALAHTVASSNGGAGARAAPRNPWNAFQARMSGTRLTRQQVAALYHEEQAALLTKGDNRDVKTKPTGDASRGTSRPPRC